MSFPSMRFLTKEEMEKLPTHRLLAYYKKLRQCGSVTQGMLEWQDTMVDAKAVLDTREHVERK